MCDFDQCVTHVQRVSHTKCFVQDLTPVQLTLVNWLVRCRMRASPGTVSFQLFAEITA